MDVWRCRTHDAPVAEALSVTIARYKSAHCGDRVSRCSLFDGGSSAVFDVVPGTGSGVL
jgi:hypothetical protein